MSISAPSTSTEFIGGSLPAIQNSKTFLGIYSSVIIDTSNVLDSADRASLVDIATQCPFIGGKAVFQARTLLQRFDTTDYTSDCEAGDTTEFRKEQLPMVKTKTQSTVSVYPNPASDIIHISYFNASDNAWFTLYDMLGKQAGSVQLTKGNGKISFSSGNIGNGLYFWKVTGLSVGGDKEGKVVIARP